MLLTGDVLDVLPTLEADSFDAMLTDPPYGIGFMGKEWDSPGAFVERRAIRGNKWDKVGGNHNPTSPLDRSRTRLSENKKYQGFMTAWAAEALRVLKPGAFALVFGGTRTFHRLAVALEDAGFELRDTLMWVYSQGFPKSLDVSKAIDKMAGAEREVVGQRIYAGGHVQRSTESIGYQGSNPENDRRDITAPATPEAERWQGYGTSLKPAYEPVLLVRKPTPLTFAQNALRHGTGALNIDGARVPFSGEADEAESKNKNRHADFGSAPRENRVYGEDGRSRAEGGNYDPPGRWPSNLIHDGSDEVLEMFPSTTSRGHTPARRGKGGIGTSGHRGQEGVTEAYFDTGSAARFFYTAKASTKERNAGLAGHNPHPTVKPLALTEHLARLLLPPERDTPRRILVPFAGSGSEIIGALRAGWDEAVGIEREPEYVAIAEKRIRHWLGEHCAPADRSRREAA